MLVEDMAINLQHGLIEKSLEKNQDLLADLVADTFNAYQGEGSDLFNSEHGKITDDALTKKMQELLVRKISQAVSTSFERGYIAGMQVAFDIVEARAMEMSGGACETVN